MLPLFVTVDTEGDNGWNHPVKITTTNANGVLRFQTLCEKYGIKPVYLTTYEMANDDVLVESLKKKNREGLCELGMHMHGWTTPPDYRLTNNDLQNLPFITEYPLEIVEEKVKTITEFLENQFEEAVISHRSGRWIVNNLYLQILVDYGYQVDCSHTPLINWSCSIGDPNGGGGQDYTACDRAPNYISLQNGGILEIPMTTMRNPVYDNLLVNTYIRYAPRLKKMDRVCNALNGRKNVMLRPDVRREKLQLKLINKLREDSDLKHVELMIHSSEVYHGTCPHCKTKEDVDRLYEIMDRMFAQLCTFCTSMTFKEYISAQN